MSAQSKRHNLLIQTEASSGLAPVCHRFIAIKLFHTRISLDALSNHGQQGKGWACAGPEERSDVLRAQGKDVTEPGCPRPLCLPCGLEPCSDAAPPHISWQLMNC